MRILHIIDRVLLICLLCSVGLFLVTYSSAEDVPIKPSKSSVHTSQKSILSNLSNTNNVSAKESISSSVTEPSAIQPTFEDLNNEKLGSSEFTFAEVASQNAGLPNEFIDTGQPAVFTLSDAATAELQQRAGISAEASQNATPNLISNTSSDATPVTNPFDDQNATAEVEDKNRSEETTQEKEIEKDNVDTLVLTTDIQNLTGTNEDIPSFSEWAQKQLEEAEKNKEVVNTSTHSNGVNGKTGGNFKIRSKNYASLDCGAKIVAANPEAVSPSALLSSSRDEYKLNACQNRIWFIVELCEAIQAKKIDLANFELFSSSPKDFSVYVSDRYPSRDWLNVGHFTAKDERDVQSYDLHPQLFGKFVKIEMHSHYGSEHFCPISLFRVYGTSEFEVLEKENQAHVSLDDDEDDETLDSDNGQAPKNLFSSATDAVISIVKKAAEVLGNKQNSSNFTTEEPMRDSPKLINSCTTPSHLVVCDNCSDVLFGEVYELISCKANYFFDLIQYDLIRKTIYFTDTCSRFGLDFKAKRTEKSQLYNEFLRSFFSEGYIAAFCNTAAVLENKVVLNISKQFPNITKQVPNELEIMDKVIPPLVLNKTEVQPTEQLTVDKIQLATSAPSDVNISTTSQIKPTKTLTPDNDINAHTTAENKDEKTIEPTEHTTENKTWENKLKEEVEDNLTEFEVTTESSEDIDLINELNLGSPIPNSPTQHTVPQVKESVFLRLSNRIKALERNMSLSGQYLEELSRRYKKQVEEMQRLLDKTLASLNEESKKRDEYNKKLEDQIKELSSIVHSLVEERNSWIKITYWVLVIFVLMFGIFTFFRRIEYKHSGDKPNVKIQRRQSIAVVNHNAPPKKNRRPSEEALKISGSYKELMRNECDVKKKVKERKKKKKKSIGRSTSFDVLPEENSDNEFENRVVNSDTKISTPNRIWKRMDSTPANFLQNLESEIKKDIEDVPFVLEESDHCPLESLPSQPMEKTFNGNVKINSPPFMRTASEVRMKRRLNNTNGAMINGNKDIQRKAISLDETTLRQSPSRLSETSSVNNSLEDVKKGPSPKKDRKGAIKRIFKKVF